MTQLDREFAHILDGAASHIEVMDFLERSIVWMSDPSALAAGARALRERMLRVEAPEDAIDVCGTGGDGANTLNISTAVAFVVAGCGVPVAKHGNRAMSSRSGAADVLEALGVNLTADAPALNRCLNEAGVAFLFAQHHHPAVRHVAAARREFCRRTIFNLLGPLANPACVRRQLVGVFAPGYVQPVAYALRELRADRAWVVHGAGGLDEVSLAGPTLIGAVEDGDLRFFDLSPIDLGALEPIAPGSIRGGEANSNAAALRALLTTPDRAIPAYASTVIANAAAALVIAGVARDIAAGGKLARQSLESGSAHRALEQLIKLSQAGP